MKSLVNTIIGTLYITTSLLYSNTPSIFSTTEKKDPVKTLKDAQRDYSHIKNKYDQAYNAWKESKDNLNGIQDKLRSDKCSAEYKEYLEQKSIAKSLMSKEGGIGATVGLSLAAQNYNKCITDGIKDANTHTEKCLSQLNLLKEQLFEISQHLTKARQELSNENINNTTKPTVSPTIKPSNPPIKHPDNSNNDDTYLHQHITYSPVFTLTGGE